VSGVELHEQAHALAMAGRWQEAIEVATRALTEIRWKGPAKVGATRLDRHQSPPLEHRREAAHRGFDLGKFRHFAPAYRGCT